MHRLRLRHLVKGGVTSTTRQEASITEQRNALRTKITNWQRIQDLYMPGLQTVLRDPTLLPLPTQPSNSNHPEDMPLWLPSAIPLDLRSRACVQSLADYEEKIRTAQCYDTLEKIRHVLRVKSRMVHFKHKNVRGQASNTRSRAVIDRVQERANHLAQYYRLVRGAKLVLSGPGSWEMQLQILNDGDVRSYQDPNRLRKRQGRRGTLDDETLERLSALPEGTEATVEGISLMPEARGRRDGTGETRRTLSWIWLVERRDGAVEGLCDDENDDILRAEWAKSRARTNRATEEVKLLREEMRRSVATLDWEARTWSERQTARTVTDRAIAEGLVSYAIKQVSIKRQLRASFQTLFKSSLQVETAAQGVNPDIVDEDDPDEGDDEQGSHNHGGSDDELDA